MSSAKQEVEAFKRRLLAEKLALVTAPQRALFDRLYPKGVPNDALESAIDLCDRTIKKNQAKAAGELPESVRVELGERP